MSPSHQCPASPVRFYPPAHCLRSPIAPINSTLVITFTKDLWFLGWHQRGLLLPLRAASASGKPECGMEAWTMKAGVTSRAQNHLQDEGGTVTMDIPRMTGWLTHWPMSPGPGG